MRIPPIHCPLLLFIACGAILYLPTGGGLPARATPDEYGPVTAIAVDAQGNGWVATGSGSQGLTLQRLVAGGFRGLTYGDPADRDRGISHMVMTARGDDGWAIGSEGPSKKPLLWRLRNGLWGPSPISLAPTVELSGIALSRDGRLGWLVGQDRKTTFGVLLRLRNDAWTPVNLPSGAIMTRIAISSDGTKGWAIGHGTLGQTHSQIFRLTGWTWSAVPSTAFPPGHVGKLVTVDDSGNGWMISGPPAKGNERDTLIRLYNAGHPARVVPVSAPPTGLNPEPLLTLTALGVNGKGDGWAVGSLYLGRYRINKDLPLEEHYKVVLVHLTGDNSAVIPEDAAGMRFNAPYNSRQANIRPTTLNIGPDGVLTLLGGVGGYGTGQLYRLHEPWPHPYPPSAPPMEGPGRCFSLTRYCMRGAFAQYWEANGGLASFGYPITTEVQEEVQSRVAGEFQTRTITVQYTQFARLECTNPACGPDEVTLGRLGLDLANATHGSLNSRLLDSAPFKPQPVKRIPGKPWVPETQHFVGPPFITFWRSTGEVRRHGYPVSEQFEESTPTAGPKTVQFFERSKVELVAGKIVPVAIGSELFYLNYGYHP